MERIFLISTILALTSCGPQTMTVHTTLEESASTDSSSEEISEQSELSFAQNRPVIRSLGFNGASFSLRYFSNIDCVYLTNSTTGTRFDEVPICRRTRPKLLHSRSFSRSNLKNLVQEIDKHSVATVKLCSEDGRVCSDDFKLFYAQSRPVIGSLSFDGSTFALDYYSNMSCVYIMNAVTNDRVFEQPLCSNRRVRPGTVIRRWFDRSSLTGLADGMVQASPPVIKLCSEDGNNCSDNFIVSACDTDNDGKVLPIEILRLNSAIAHFVRTYRDCGPGEMGTYTCTDRSDNLSVSMEKDSVLKNDLNFDGSVDPLDLMIVGNCSRHMSIR
jgi:hypothetical protein